MVSFKLRLCQCSGSRLRRVVYLGDFQVRQSFERAILMLQGNAQGQCIFRVGRVQVSSVEEVLDGEVEMAITDRKSTCTQPKSWLPRRCIQSTGENFAHDARRGVCFGNITERIGSFHWRVSQCIKQEFPGRFNLASAEQGEYVLLQPRGGCEI